MTALSVPCVSLVTDRAVCGGGERLVAAVEAAVRGGVRLVQLREKDLPAGELLALAMRLRTVTHGRALLFVNDRVDVALAAGADGVQLGEAALPVEAARAAVAGRPLLIGRSVHDVPGGLTAARAGADVLVAGTLFPSASHDGAPAAGVTFVRALTRATRVPVLGIGGITADDASEVIAAGAAGVAVIREVLAARDPQAAARALCDAVERAWAMRSRERHGVTDTAAARGHP